LLPKELHSSGITAGFHILNKEQCSAVLAWMVLSKPIGYEVYLQVPDEQHLLGGHGCAGHIVCADI